MVTMEQLQTFRAIVRAGTFSGAADELFLTQPAISQRISQMEHALGVDLFLRDGNRRALHLTKAGERVLAFADDVAALTERLQLDIKDMNASGERETVTIVCSSTALRYILPSFLAAYYERQPSARVNVMQASGGEIPAAVHAGGADLGIVLDRYVDHDLQFVPLVAAHLVLIAMPGHPILADPEQWIRSTSRCNFILPPSNSPMRQRVERWGASLHLRIEVPIETYSLDFMKAAAMQGLGLAMVPEWGVVDEVRDGRLAIVHAPGMPIEGYYYLVFKAEYALSSVAKGFLEIGKQGLWRLPVRLAPTA